MTTVGPGYHISGEQNSDGLHKPVKMIEDKWKLLPHFLQVRTTRFVATDLTTSLTRLFRTGLAPRAGQAAH